MPGADITLVYYIMLEGKYTECKKTGDLMVVVAQRWKGFSNPLLLVHCNCFSAWRVVRKSIVTGAVDGKQSLMRRL